MSQVVGMGIIETFHQVGMGFGSTGVLSQDP